LLGEAGLLEAQLEGIASARIELAGEQIAQPIEIDRLLVLQQHLFEFACRGRQAQSA
jgi:hypothetical protein